jgi:hypothetical protein
MRLVLVEHGGERVFGDSAVFAARSPEWAENTFQRAGIAKLSVIAARLLDESDGRFQWNYEFAPFGPGERGGYDVFLCAEDLDEAPPHCLQEFSNVLCRCFYMGFVYCLQPVIPLEPRKRSANAEKRAEWPSEAPDMVGPQNRVNDRR